MDCHLRPLSTLSCVGVKVPSELDGAAFEVGGGKNRLDSPTRLAAQQLDANERELAF